jgi:hypothetical protein
MAVEAFMRANGLSDSTIYAGEQYVMPSSTDYAASTGEMGQVALNQDNAGIATNPTDQNQSPLPDVRADLEVDVNLDFLQPNGPGSRVESSQMMDHGLVDAQRQEQLRNIAPIMDPINEWMERVEGRVNLFISDPAEALEQGLNDSFPFFDSLGRVRHDDIVQALEQARTHEGDIDLDPQAFNDLLGILPLAGIGTTGRVLNSAPDSGLPTNAIGRPIIDVADDAVNKHLVDLPIHTSPERSFIRAEELLNDNNILQRHATNDLQRLGSSQAGHGGVQNLSNDELLRFGGPRGTDPIGGFREFQEGDDLRLPGSRFNIKEGHHRLEEITNRVRAGQINPNTLIEIQIIQP